MKNILVIGSLNMDHVTAVDHIVQPGETILAKSFEKVPGGKGANQAYAIGKLGGRVAMLGMVGKEDVLIPGHRVKAVDTTAAGDSFVAGLAVKLAEGKDINEAIDYAQRVSAVVVTRKGAQSSIPSPDEVL